MSLQVFIRSQSDLLNEVRAEVGDEAKSRWPQDSSIYRGLNQAIDLWANKVLIPRLYTISGGFVSTTYEYALPDYMDGAIEVWRRQVVGPWGDSIQGEQSHRVWERISTYSVEATAAGGRTLRLHYNPSSTEARIIWWGRNGPLPVSSTLPVLSAQIDGDDTTLTLTTKPTVGRSGFIKIEAEWLSYAGLTEGATTLTLDGLVRGLFGTTAATHTGTTSVEWGIGVHDLRLYRQATYECIAYLHGLYLNKAVGDQRERHMDQARLYKQMALDLYRQIPQSRPPVIGVGRAGIGGPVGQWPFSYIPEG